MAAKLSDDKKMIEEKRYAILSKESIKAFAEATGHSDLSDDVASLLSEDVVYRLREATQNSCQFMRHARRQRLSTEDFNKALRNSDIQQVLGYNNLEPLGFRQTREGELHIPDDPEINLVEEAGLLQPPHHPGQTTIKAHWLAVEGLQKGGSLQQGVPGKGLNGKVAKVSDDLLAYYENVTTAILGYDEPLIEFALGDLRTNTKIAPLLPYLVNFISNGVKTVSHDTSQLTKLLHTVRAIFNNKSLFLEPRPYLNLLVHSVLYCLLEPLAASINPANDHWAVRDYAARILAQITKQWSSPVNQLAQQNLKALKDVLQDASKPFCCHYGAITGLIAFGIPALEDILLPQLTAYWSHLLGALEGTTAAPVKSDAYKVYGAVQLAAELLVRSKTLTLLSESEQQGGEECEVVQRQLSLRRPSLRRAGSKGESKDKVSASAAADVDLKKSGGSLMDPPTPYVSACASLLSLYRQLYECFGSSLAARLPVFSTPGVYIARREEIVVSLADEFTRKSGEELLQTFLEVDRERVTPTDDVDMDEQSERSSRSERSHSDESYVYEQTDLTAMKATMSHPSEGIKLTILKRPKRDSESEMYGNAPGARYIKKRRLTSQSSRDSLLRHMFEPVALVRPVRFIFRYAGCVQCSEPKGKKWTIPALAKDRTLITLSCGLKPYGKRPYLGRTSTSKYIHFANLNTFL